MSLELVSDQPVQFTIVYKHGTMVQVFTTSSLIDHFLRRVKVSQSEHTWINYAHDLKIFFAVVCQPLEKIDRQSCVAFMEQQDRAGMSSLTINRRLAAMSSLFTELNLLAPATFPRNPVAPLQRNREVHKRNQSLYRKQPDRVPDVIAEQDLQTFFELLPSWRDRVLILLMWISCLRISEVVAIRFEDIECSHRSIHIRKGKGGHPRTVFMDCFTFAALNKYIDEERRDLFPEVDEVFIAFKGVARGRPLTVNAHLFRHTGITQLVQQGMSEPAIRKLVGHRNAYSLEPYLHISDRFVEAEFEKAQIVLDPKQWLQLAPGGGLS